MKKNILIAFLLFISIYSRGNNLTIQPNNLRLFTNSAPTLMNDKIYSQQVRGDSINSVTKNGVSFSYSFSLRYYLSDGNYITTLQTKNRKSDTNEGIHPEIIEIMNGIYGQYNIEEIYCFKRQEIEALILKKLRSRFEKDHIKIDAILLRSIQFSEILKKQIEERLRKEQLESESINNND